MKFFVFIFSAIFLTSCSFLFEPEYFGVKESVWNTLSEESRQAAIAGYNERERRELELRAERQRRQQEIDAKNAPYEYALKIAETMAENQHPFRIKEMDSLFGKITLNNGDIYRVEDRKEIQHWGVSQDLVVYRTGSGVYPFTLENLLTRERVTAKKL